MSTSEFGVRGQHPGFAWRELLAGHQVSQAELAKRAGVSKKHINQIMQARALPSAALVTRMCSALDETRPPESRDGGRRLARLMWSIQSHWVLDEAVEEVNET